MNTRSLFAAALALPMLFACTKENITPSLEGKGFDFSVTVSSDEDTKAVFDDAEGILWVNPGSAGLVTSEFNTVVAQKSSAATASPNGRQSTFKFEGITAGSYRLFYPYAETYYPNIKFTVPANQTQEAGKTSSDIFAGMATEDVTATQGENNIQDVTYKTVGSYIQFRVYGKEGETVRYISVVSSDSKLAGEYRVNATDFTYTIMDGGTDRVLVALGEAGYTTTADFESSTGIYAAVLPGTSTNTYYVTTDKATYVFASSSAKEFAAGSIKCVKLNLDNAKVGEQTVPTELYIVGDVTYVGWDCTKAKKMEKNGNVFSTDVYLSTDVKNADNKVEKAEGFKFLTQTVNWKIGYVNVGGKLAYRSETNGVADTKFTVDKAGYYHVEANFDTKEVTCTPKAPEKLYVWGAATEAGWDNGKPIELTKSGDFAYSATEVQLLANEDFKFFSEDSESTAYVNDGNGNVIFFDSPTYSDADKKFNVDKSGKYTVSVDLSSGVLTTDLTTEFPRVISNHKKKTYWMLPTGNEGEFKASGVFIDKIDNNKSEAENANSHDFFILVGDSEAYNENGNFTNISSFDANSDYTYTAGVTKNTSTGIGWWISDDNKQTKRLYDITLNTSANTITVKFTQGKNFWLIGTPFAGYNAFNKPDEFKGTADENGIVTWNVTTKNTGDWKICGENTLSDSFYDGEWYYSTEDKSENKYLFNWSWTSGNNYGQDFDVNVYCGNDQKWNFNETGTFEIVFDTKNLKIKVTKQEEQQQ